MQEHVTLSLETYENMNGLRDELLERIEELKIKNYELEQELGSYKHAEKANKEGWF